MQAICDHKRRFIDIDISHPARTSDYLAFATSPICQKLEKKGFIVAERMSERRVRNEVVNISFWE